MNRDELKARVTAAINETWPIFQREHPALAQVIDQAMLSEHVVASLQADVEFQAAYENAVAAKIGAQAFSALLSRFVGVALARLR